MFNFDDYLRFTGDAEDVTVTSSSTESNQLEPGVYIMMSDVACWWNQGATGGTATAAAPSKRMPADFAWAFRVTGNDDDHIQVIRDSTDGNLQIIPAGRTLQR